MNIGIIGAGNIAKRMATNINLMNCDITNYAIASRDINKAIKFQKEYGFVKIYNSYEDLIKDPNVHLVYIATPHSFHYEHMLLCLKHNKPVLCEKIFTTSQEDTYMVFEMFEEKHLFLCEAMWTAFMPCFKIIDKLLFKDKIIGSIKSYDGYFYDHMMDIERIKKKSLGGGVLMDIGIYPLMFLFKTLGYKFKDYSVKKIKAKGDVDCSEEIEFQYKNAIRATCHVDGNKDSCYNAIFIGEKGKITISPIYSPQIINIYDNDGIIKESIDLTTIGEGFQYELLACKQALENDETECKNWTHQETKFLIKIVEEILNCM